MQQTTGELSRHSAAVNHQSPISNTKVIDKRLAKICEIMKLLVPQRNWNLSKTHPHKFPPENLFDIFQDVQVHQKIPNVQQLFLHWNELPSLILIPARYAFTDLKALNLGGNNIESLQALHQANFDKLEELWLWHNNLVSVESLRKCHFPSLKRLDIGDNNIQESPKMFQMYCPQLKLLNIEKNGFTHLQNFAKLLINTSTNHLLLQFTCNQIVKAFQHPCKKGKKMINQLTYTRKNGTVNLKFH